MINTNEVDLEIDRSDALTSSALLNAADPLEAVRDCTACFIRSTFTSCSERLVDPGYLPPCGEGLPVPQRKGDVKPPKDVALRRRRVAQPLLPTLPDSSIGARVSFSPKQKLVFDAENPELTEFPCYVVTSQGFPGCAATLYFHSVFDVEPTSLTDAVNEGLVAKVTVASSSSSAAPQSKSPLLHPRCVTGATSRVMKSPVWHACMRNGGIKFIHGNKTVKGSAVPRWTVYWGGRLRDPSVLKALLPEHRVNHFPGTWCLGRKDNLAANLKRAQQRHPAQYGFAPFTYLLPHDLPLLQRDAREGVVFILKPPAGACGRGIQVFQGAIPDEVYNSGSREPRPALKKRVVPEGPIADSGSSSGEEAEEDDVAVVQRYITNPLLINGFKTDLRVYVAVTSYDPLKIYIYNEGLLRFATSKYDLANIKDSFGHLTNFSVNKRSENFKKAGASDDDDSSKWTLHAMKRYFESQGWDFNRTWSSVEEIVVKTIMACESSVATYVLSAVPHRFSCFEVYGFDVMFDDTFKAHLIEVNVMPSLASGSALDKHVKGHMVADLLTLVGVTCGGAEGCNNVSFKSQSRKATPPHTAGYFTPLSCIDQEELHMLRLHELELHRSGGFDCIFPSSGAREHYADLYTPRHMTELLVAWESLKQRLVSAGKPLAPLLEALRASRLPPMQIAAPKRSPSTASIATRSRTTSKAAATSQSKKVNGLVAVAAKPTPPTQQPRKSLTAGRRNNTDVPRVVRKKTHSMPPCEGQVPITTFDFGGV